MATYLAIIYTQQIGIESEESDVQKRVQPSSAASLQAVNDAEAAMAYCRDEIIPELVSPRHNRIFLSVLILLL